MCGKYIVAFLFWVKKSAPIQIPGSFCLLESHHLLRKNTLLSCDIASLLGLSRFRVIYVS